MNKQERLNNVKHFQSEDKQKIKFKRNNKENKHKKKDWLNAEF